MVRVFHYLLITINVCDEEALPLDAFPLSSELHIDAYRMNEDNDNTQFSECHRFPEKQMLHLYITMPALGLVIGASASRSGDLLS